MYADSYQTDFIIAGPVIDEDQCYYNVEHNGWVNDIKAASTFPKEIMLEKLPLDTTGIMELTAEGQFVNFYEIEGNPLFNNENHNPWD